MNTYFIFYTDYSGRQLDTVEDAGSEEQAIDQARRTKNINTIIYIRIIH